MNARLSKPLQEADLKKRVSKIAYDRDGDQKGSNNAPMSVKLHDEEDSRKYITVFATPTLACLQRIDLTGLELLYEQKDAIRSLHYDTASKVGMKFKKAWWIEMGIEGGLGKTDMPLRTWYAHSTTRRRRKLMTPVFTHHTTWMIRRTNRLCCCAPIQYVDHFVQDWRRC